MDLATVDKLLTTTRTVRKRLDLTRSVDPEIIQTCLEIAIQAPTGGNIPRYHFVVVTDTAKRTALAALYKRAYFEVYSPQRQAEVSQSDPRLIESATYLAEHMHEVPVLIIPSVSHLLHTRRSSHLWAFLYKRGNVKGEVLDRLIDLNVMLPGCCRPDPVVIFLQSAQQAHPRFRV